MVVAAIALLIGLWRAAIASAHLIAARAITDDPSMRELEQVSAAMEGVAAAIAFLHAAAAVSMARTGLRIETTFTVSMALYCAIVIAAALLGFTPFTVPGLFPLAVALGAFTLSMLMPFSWLSLYFGVVAGGVAAWALAAPQGDVLACVFVIGPCVIYALAGAAIGRRFARSGRATGAG